MKKWGFNPSGAETGIFGNELVNTIIVDGLVSEYTGLPSFQ